MSASLDSSLTRRDLLPSAWSLLWVVGLFAGAIALTHWYAAPLSAALGAHGDLGLLIFFGTTALAVVLPMFSNLPLVPFAVLLWGPWATALILILGWMAGAAASFSLARRLRQWMLRRFPNVLRYARIDLLIAPRHHITSLIVLRMTFPVDILSYVLGLFSHKTTWSENAVSTAIGGAPFALLFAFFPALPLSLQLTVFALSALAFGAYVLWVMRDAHRTRIQEGS